MKKEEYFYLDESPSQPGRYLIRIDFDKLPPMTTVGSYQVLFARIMNLSFAQYLRLCRDEFEGEIVGKDSLYPTVYFKRTPKTVSFIRLLNGRMNLIMWEREHPDWKEHEKLLAQHKRNKEKK